MRILLVEDDEKLKTSLAFQLEQENFIVDTCSDGEEALYYIEQNIHDLILLDRMLPYLSGTEVLLKMRRSNNQTPVILITALGTLDDKVTGLDLGADDYLVKPFAFEELMARIPPPPQNGTDGAACLRGYRVPAGGKYADRHIRLLQYVQTGGMPSGSFSAQSRPAPLPYSAAHKGMGARQRCGGRQSG